MIYPEEDPIKFGLKHGIEITTDKCRKCQSLVSVDIPVISKDFVGFESEPHYPCGPQYKIIYLKPRDSRVLGLLLGDYDDED